MEWLFAFILLFGNVDHAADHYAKAEAELTAQLLRMELEHFTNEETAHTVIKEGWTLLPEAVKQGDVVLVRSSEEGEIEWEGLTYPLLPYGTGFYAYLPISNHTEPGTYEIGDESLTVLPANFETQWLTVTEEQEAMRRNTKRIEEDQIKINQARSSSEPSFLFKEPFLLPVTGRLTTPYGYTRYVNGKYSGSHFAIDLAAPQGTPVYAANNGKVVLAESLYLAGNSIYLDHGMNLFSQYSHLSKLHVETGDWVEVGDLIGEIGSTGFSTGPHLHFAFWIGNRPVNPNLFFDTTPFMWQTN